MSEVGKTKFDLLLVGDAAVGKTSLIQNYN
jgi:small GTP-binding protein